METATEAAMQLSGAHRKELLQEIAAGAGVIAAGAVESSPLGAVARTRLQIIESPPLRRRLLAPAPVTLRNFLRQSQISSQHERCLDNKWNIRQSSVDHDIL